MLYTISKNKKQYTAQITPHRGYVNAEIICTNLSSYNEDNSVHICVCHKSFGSFFRTAPTEKDWINANYWVSTQLKYIEKYGTTVVKQPENLIICEKLIDNK